MKVRRLLGELNGTYPLEYTHNGRELEKEGILYTTTDPQIHISGIVPGTGRLCAELTVEELSIDGLCLYEPAEPGQVGGTALWERAFPFSEKTEKDCKK